MEQREGEKEGCIYKQQLGQVCTCLNIFLAPERRANK